MSRVYIDNISPISTRLENTKIRVDVAQADGILGPKAFKVESKIVGMRTFVLALAALGIAVHTLGIWDALGKSNKLKEQEIKIQKEQLDLARRQFQLDSIAMTQNQKIR